MKHRKTKRGKKTAWTLNDTDWDQIKNVFPVKTIGSQGGRLPVAMRRRQTCLGPFCAGESIVG